MPKPEDYEARCSEWARSPEDVHVWVGLGRILGGRVEWYFVEPTGTPAEAMWCFGLAGEARLVATADRGRCCLYVHDRDREEFFDGPSDFNRWLDEHEHEYEGLSPLGQELFGHLLPGQVDEWRERQGEES